MKQPPSPSPEPPLIRRNKRDAAAAGDGQGSGSLRDNSSPSANESVHALLKRICDLLENRVQEEEEQRYEDDKENQMKDDWMLAAAVLDRFCTIAFAVIFVTGSVIFFIVFESRT